SVSRGDDPFLWRLLASFKRMTGSSVLLNTSFNLKGEPIVETPRDAVRTFFASGLERMLLENYEVWK
ncbi:MAG: carbamoyltransferase, partial [Actinomycetota bacterium]|nr:carbamoyltransferase [Actinomycetota bacterium]